MSFIKNENKDDIRDWVGILRYNVVFLYHDSSIFNNIMMMIPMEKEVKKFTSFSFFFGEFLF